MNPNKRFSNRTYPERICLQCSELFIPTDARQLFCCTQHRIDYNNDRRKIKDAPMRAISDELKKNDAVLKKASGSLERLRQKSVSKDLLQYDGYDFKVSSSVSINNETGKKVYWNIIYGIEGLDAKMNSFIIHKR